VNAEEGGRLMSVARGERWFVMSGGAWLRSTAKISFEACLERAESVSECGSEWGVQILEDFSVLERDLRRMVALGRCDSREAEAAGRVLKASSLQESKGYVQGELAVVLFLMKSLLDMERTFWTFIALRDVLLGGALFTPDAARAIREGIKRKRLEIVSGIDVDAVVELLARKWLLQLWCDPDVIKRREVSERILDCLFLTGAGSRSLQTPAAAIQNILRQGDQHKARPTRFHVQLAIALIDSAPLLRSDSQDYEGLPKLRRKLSLEEMGAHATGEVFNSILRWVAEVDLNSFERIATLAFKVPEVDIQSIRKQPREEEEKEKDAEEGDPCIIL